MVCERTVYERTVCERTVCERTVWFSGKEAEDDEALLVAGIITQYRIRDSQRGTVAEWFSALVTSAEVCEFRTQHESFLKLALFTQQYLILFRAEQDERP